MKVWKAVVSISIAALPLLTCRKDNPANETEPASTQVTFFKDIQPLIKERCAGCHDAGQIAFSLNGYPEVSDKKEAIVTAVASRRMPIWPAAAGHQLYKEDPSLSDTEIALFKQWQEAGYLQGREADAPRNTPTTMLTDLQADVTLPILPAGVSYLPTQDRPDDYRCFVVKWPDQTSVQYVTGFQGIPGDRRIVHHLVAYKVTAKILPIVHDLDAEESGPGYRCFNGAMPDRLWTDEVFQRMMEKYPGVLEEKNWNSEWLGHWAPGMRGHMLPAGTGIPVQPGGAFVIQVHYYSAGSPQTADSGGKVQFTIAPQVEKPGFVMPFSNDDWLAGKEARTLVVPVGQELTVHYSSTLSRVIDEGQSELGITREVEALEIHSANLHMHSYGKSAAAYLTKASDRETLLEIPRWNLNWQQDFTFAKPKIFTAQEAADVKLHLECTFTNQTDHEVYGGLGSDDEMCFNFAYVALVLKK